jgi:hypothetical protein
LNFANHWMKCLDSRAFIELVKPFDCESTLESRNISVFKSETSLANPNIQITIDNPQIEGQTFTYWTNYSIRVDVMIGFGGEQRELLVSKLGFNETGKIYLVDD